MSSSQDGASAEFVAGSLSSLSRSCRESPKTNNCTALVSTICNVCRTKLFLTKHWIQLLAELTVLIRDTYRIGAIADANRGMAL